MKLTKLILSGIFLAGCLTSQAKTNYYDPTPFGDADRRAKDSDNLAIGEWWKLKGKEEAKSSKR